MSVDSATLTPVATKPCERCCSEGVIYSGHPNDPHPRAVNLCTACDGIGEISPTGYPVLVNSTPDYIEF